MPKTTTTAAAEPTRVDAPPSRRFQSAAAGDRPSLASEFVFFLKHSKKWWLLPILLLLAGLMALALAGGSGLAPFIYASW